MSIKLFNSSFSTAFFVNVLNLLTELFLDNTYRESKPEPFHDPFLCQHSLNLIDMKL
jgi:hypothetical protein